MCDICANDFNKSNRKCVTCFSCNEKACKECTRSYILSGDTFASCMFCKIDFPPIFLVDNLNQSWFNGLYRKHRELILLNKQKQLLPATQEAASHKMEKTKLEREITVQCRKLRQETYELACLRDENKDAPSQELRDKIKNKMLTKRHLLIHIAHLNDKAKRPETFYDDSPSVNLKCPKEDCKGCIKDFHCSLCLSDICSECMEVKAEDHQCDKETVESVKLLMKDSKPCPGCHSFISKINGCDQMWCTLCKVAFSWNTGAIDSGNIHNPEYYRWIREGGQIVENIPNDNHAMLPFAHFYFDYIHRLNIPDDDSRTTLINLHQFVGHFTALADDNTQSARCAALLRNRRIDYLCNFIDEKQWSTAIFKTVNDTLHKQKDINAVRIKHRNLCHRVVWQICEDYHAKQATNYSAMIEDIEKSRIECNAIWERLSKVYRCKMPSIHKLHIT
jgi:hypothetical protein